MDFVLAYSKNGRNNVQRGEWTAENRGADPLEYSYMRRFHFYCQQRQTIVYWIITMMNKRFTALLVSKDSDLLASMEESLKETFNLQVYQFEGRELRETLRVAKPLVILWDGRDTTDKWHYMVHWLREHFHGCPLLALLEVENPPHRMDLYKMGINLIINVNSHSFHENLFTLIGAIIDDLRLNGNPSHNPFICTYKCN
jgi:hypothetical protein